MRLALLSNVNLDLLDPHLAKSFELYKPDGYGQWVQETFAPSPGLIDFAPEVLAVVLDGTALVEAASDDTAAAAEIDAALGHVERLVSHFPAVPLYVSRIDIRPRRIVPADALRSEDVLARRWAEGLDSLVAAHTTVHVFDLAALVAEQGRKAIYSDKMWYMGSVPYSIKGTGVIADALAARIGRASASRKKVLIVDLDNTLWGGVLGEDGPDGIQLGRSLVGAAYRDAQVRMKELAASGILLAIASKNDEDLVRSVLRDHPQMALREDDFVAIMANWEPKAANIAALATTLNLGLDSFVFLDDNPVEQEAVRRELPAVTVVDFPRDVSKLPDVVAGLFDECFFAARLTSEDAVKKQQYQAEALRASTKAQAASMEDYLASLGIEISLTAVRDDQVQRTAQLTGKTNQFNLVTARFSPEELEAYRARPGHHVYVANVADRFGDSGLVFVLMVSVAGDEATIDNLLMSCRVMGRHIEDAIVEAVEVALASEGVTRVRAAFVPTGRNTPVRELLDRLGYDRAGETSERVDYVRVLGAAAPERKVLHPVTWGER